MFCTDCCSVASHLQDDGDVEDDMTIREVRCTTSPSNESVRDQRVNCFGKLKNGGTTKFFTSLGVTTQPVKTQEEVCQDGKIVPDYVIVISSGYLILPA